MAISESAAGEVFGCLPVSKGNATVKTDPAFSLLSTESEA
jgi:hypothetical protein